jgi:hypothetical protein
MADRVIITIRKIIETYHGKKTTMYRVFRNGKRMWEYKKKADAERYAEGMRKERRRILRLKKR